MQLLMIPLGIQILVMRQVESTTGKHQRMQMHVAQKYPDHRKVGKGFCVVVVGGGYKRKIRDRRSD